MLVWCLIIDHDRTRIGDAFRVHCDPGLIIDALKVKLIASVAVLQDVSPVDLRVYHSSAIKADMAFHALDDVISKLDLFEAALSPALVVTDVTSGIELLIFQKLALRKFYAIRTSCLQSTSSKRPFVPSELNDYEILERSKVARLAPSAMAKASTYPSIQKDPEQRILDDRPTTDFQVAPIALHYLPFGEFMDTYDSGVWPNDLYPIDLQKTEKNVVDLAEEMSLYHDSEAKQRIAAIPFLDKIFEFAFRPGDVGESARSDGHCDVEGLISTIAEWKKALVGITTFPHAQCVGYVAHSHVDSDRVKDLCSRRKIPALGMTFIGELIQFHAIILLGHQYHITPLTTILSFAHVRDRQRLLKAFIAANVLQRQIHRDLQSYIDLKSEPDKPSPHISPALPSVSRIRKYGGEDVNENYIEFDIFDSFAGTGKKTYRNRHLYRAKLTVAQPGFSCDSEILIKFSQMYSIELHDFCSERGHAPTILGFEKLPDGWFTVAMQYIPDAAPITYLSPDLQRNLETLVEDFHGKGFVHGDLRAANILCNRSGNNFWLIDFDWGGKDGEAKYPTTLLNEELQNGRQARDNLIIRQEDDIRILRATLDALQLQ